MRLLRRTVLLLFLGCCLAPLAIGQQTLRVKIQAAQFDRQLLFNKLNDRGAPHHLRFVLVEQGFDYRIAYGTAGGPVMTPYGPTSASASVTKVFDPTGAELFDFARNGRWTPDAAANATAKEIIKRIRKLRNLN
ncbi:MAG: hypothetical protein WA192_00860 [Candidatus Acidiferrales bacterium]